MEDLPGFEPLVEPPYAIVYLLHDFFFPLSAARGGSGFGPMPLQYSEIRAYCLLYQLRLESWEVGVLISLDRAWFEETQSKTPKASA